MKRICILSTVNFKHMTLISLYTNYLDEENIPYDIIHIDKYQENEYSAAANVYRYSLHIERDWSTFKKMTKYYSFKKFAKKIIEKNKYDFIIVWNSQTALLFFDYLSLRYKDRYSLNIRDYNKENFKPIYMLMKRVIKNASFTTISSEGFKSFLPTSNYINVYSFNEKLLKTLKPTDKIKNKNDQKPIKITFLGYVRFIEMDKLFLDILGNDSRFIIQYFGEGAEMLKKYANEKNIKNVNFHGRFDVSQTVEFLKETDIINNLYGTGTPGLRTALSIKLYYAIYMKIPILVHENTYMNEVSKEFNFNITIQNPLNRNLGDVIYNSYYDIDFNELKLGSEKYLELINESKKEFNLILEKHFL